MIGQFDESEIPQAENQVVAVRAFAESLRRIVRDRIGWSPT